MEQAVIFKHEDELDGMPMGPMRINEVDGPLISGTTRLYVPKCTCEQPDGRPLETCKECGGEIPKPWVTLAEAKLRADELGLELREE